MRRPEAGERRREHARIGGRGHVADGDPARLAPPGPAHGGQSRVGLEKRLAGLLQEDLAGQRELDRAPAAIEQSGAHQRLQVEDLLAQPRLGDAEPLRGAAEVPLLGQGHEVAQVPQLERARRLVDAHDPPLASAIPQALTSKSGLKF